MRLKDAPVGSTCRFFNGDEITRTEFGFVYNSDGESRFFKDSPAFEEDHVEVLSVNRPPMAAEFYVVLAEDHEITFSRPHNFKRYTEQEKARNAAKHMSKKYGGTFYVLAVAQVFTAGDEK